MLLPGKRLILCFAAGALTCGPVLSGERVEFKGSTSVELPKPKRSIDEARTMRSEPERPNLQGGFVAPPPAENSPLSDRKLRESLDKKKNWIYANPYEEHFDSKTEQFMKGEKDTGLYDNQWMDSKEEKTLVQKFLEEKKQRSKESNSRNNEEKPDRERSKDREGQRDSIGDRKESDDRRESSSFLSNEKNSQFETAIFKSGPGDSFISSPLDKKLEKQSSLDMSLAPTRSSLIDKDELRQQQIAHEKEFDQILQNRLGSGSGAGLGKIDVLTPAADIGRLDFDSGNRRSEPGALNLSRPVATPGTTVTFTDGASPFGSRSSFDTRSSSDGFGFGGPAKAPTLAPSLAPPPVSQTPAFAPAPFSLPFPQRKF